MHAILPKEILLSQTHHSKSLLGLDSNFYTPEKGNIIFINFMSVID